MRVKNISYGYGEYCSIKLENASAKSILKKAMNEGYSYIVKYVDIPGQKAWKRTLMGWNIKVLGFEDACHAAADNPVMLNMIKHARSQGKHVFIKAPIKDGFEIFPAVEFDVIKIMTSKDIAAL